MLVRIQFSKTGPARYISHLDLSRTMSRALRRSNLPIWYTEGFNKHAYVTFAAPLSLGYEGLREYMDIKLEQEFPPEQIKVALEPVMPAGLQILSAAAAVMKPGELASAAYRLTLNIPPEMVEQWLKQDSITVEKRSKKSGVKTVELKGYLENVKLTARTEHDAETRHIAEMACKPGAHNSVLQATLPCSSAETINPSLLVEAMSSYCGFPVECIVTREALYNTSGKIFA